MLKHSFFFLLQGIWSVCKQHHRGHGYIRKNISIRCFKCMTGVIRLKKDHVWKAAEHILPPSHLAPANIWWKIQKETDPDVRGSWKKTKQLNDICTAIGMKFQVSLWKSPLRNYIYFFTFSIFKFLKFIEDTWKWVPIKRWCKNSNLALSCNKNRCSRHDCNIEKCVCVLVQPNHDLSWQQQRASWVKVIGLLTQTQVLWQSYTCTSLNENEPYTA